MAYVLWSNNDPDVLGFLSMFLNDEDPRDAVTQINASYGHGGGWNDFPGFKLRKSEHTDGGDFAASYALHYPGDPAYREMSRAYLRDELIVLFQHAWVAVIQKDGSFRAARID